MKLVNDTIQFENREEIDRLMLMCERYKLTVPKDEKDNISFVDRLYDLAEALWIGW